jgi:hypothetical protein
VLSEYEAQQRHEELMRLAKRGIMRRGVTRPPRKSSKEVYALIAVVFVISTAWIFILLASFSSTHAGDVPGAEQAAASQCGDSYRTKALEQRGDMANCIVAEEAASGAG